MNINFKEKKGIIFFLFCPLAILIFAGFYIFVLYPIDFIFYDEIWLLYDIYLNGDTLDLKELLKHKGGTKMPLWKIFFLLSANNEWIHHNLYIFSGFLSELIIFSIFYFSLKSENRTLNFNLFYFVAIILLIRPASYFIFYNGLISLRQFEIYIISSLAILGLLCLNKNQNKLYLLFFFLACFVSAITVNGFAVGIILGTIIVSFFCFKTDVKSLFVKIITIILFITTYYIFTHGVRHVNQTSLIDFFHIWKNISWFIYFFINPFFDILNIFNSEKYYILRLAFGSIVISTTLYFLFKNYKYSILLKISFLMFLATLFNSAILYVGESMHIDRLENLKLLSNYMSPRWTISPCSTLSLAFLFGYFSTEKKFDLSLIKFKLFSNSYIYFILITLIVFLTIKDFKKFTHKHKQRYEVTIRVHKNLDLSLPCYKRIGFWREFNDREELECMKIINLYKDYKSNERKMRLKLF